MLFKTRKVCSHTLAAAADNKDLQEFVDAYLSGNISHNATPAATAGGNKISERGAVKLKMCKYQGAL